MDTFDDRNEKRIDIVIATFHLVIIVELNFARRQEQTVPISSEMLDYTSLDST